MALGQDDQGAMPGDNGVSNTRGRRSVRLVAVFTQAPLALGGIGREPFLPGELGTRGLDIDALDQRVIQAFFPCTRDDQVTERIRASALQHDRRIKPG